MPVDPFPENLRPALATCAPSPLGATPDAEGTRFAVFSRHATAMTLVLFDAHGRMRAELALDPARHRTGDVWHARVDGIGPGAAWAWRADSRASGPEHGFDADALLLDPYAKGVAGSGTWGERGGAHGPLRGVVLDLAHDWSDDRRPRIALSETVIHEAHVRTLTAHPSARVRHPGTFEGVAEMLPRLRDLGFTTLQLMPVAEFDETDNPRRDPATGARLWNQWGYAPLAFMAPRTAYAADPTAAGALASFRALVRAAHAHGLEVVLDVVFNHVGEGPRGSAPRSWRGLDRASYFLLDERGRDVDTTGCGHTFACGRPEVSAQVLDALAFWANDMGVDGFRFDLAATLTRGPSGEPLDDPPLVRAICEDPRLAHVKLIAEAWDAVGLYKVGTFPHHGRFAELNDRFRDGVREWLRGTGTGPGALAMRLAGSSDLYAPKRSPGHSVNYLTSHDGFTLADLVSYDRKHNDANGEGGRDGSDHERSWNCGVEGDTSDPAVLALRARQVRNAAALLLLSRGALLWRSGDEVLLSHAGNNNPWCQDGPAWWVDHDPTPRQADFHRFVKGLLGLRRAHAVLHGDDWFRVSGPGSVRWHAPDLTTPDWDHGGLRLTMHVPAEQGPSFVLVVNGEPEEAVFQLPPCAPGAWHRIVDTAAEPPHDFTPLAEAEPVSGPCTRTGRSLLLLASR